MTNGARAEEHMLNGLVLFVANGRRTSVAEPTVGCDVKDRATMGHAVPWHAMWHG